MTLVSELITRISSDSTTHMQVVSSAIQKRLHETLDDMHELSDDIVISVVSSADGNAWASKLSQGKYDQHRLSAMGSTILAVSDSLAKETEKGTPQNIVIEGTNGNVYVMHAGNNLILTVVTKNTSNLGLTLAYAKQTAEKIAGMSI